MVRPRGGWLVTFADLAALVLAFFVLYLSMAEIDRDRLARLVAAYLGVLPLDGAPPDPAALRAPPLPEPAPAPEEEAVRLARTLSLAVEDLPPRCRPAVRAVETAVRLVLTRELLAEETLCRGIRRDLARRLRRIAAGDGDLVLVLAGAPALEPASWAPLTDVADRVAGWLGRRPAVLFDPRAGPDSAPELWYRLP